MSDQPHLQTRRKAPGTKGKVLASKSNLLLLVSILLIIAFLANARLLVSLGLDSRFYYIIVVILGVLVSQSLFGAVRSYAVYRGKGFGGTLELGGPVVCFFLVVILGFRLAPQSSNFALTVYVHGPAGQQDSPLRSQGEVWLDLGGDRRNVAIDDKGQAIFPEIPASFRGQKVNVGLDVSGYERRDTRPLLLEGTSLYVEVRRKPLHITGNVVDEIQSPVVGAIVSVAGISTKTLEQGRFDLELPSGRVQDDMVMRVSADGYQPQSKWVIPGSGPVGVKLRR